jgi:hypothetical protein
MNGRYEYYGVAGFFRKIPYFENFKNKNPIPIFDFGIRRQSETEKCGRTSMSGQRALE